jgi:hypothetical protein
MEENVVSPRKVWEVQCKIKGKELATISHRTETRFSFWDRIKILFGMPVFIKTTIYTNVEAVPIFGSEEDVTFVPNLIMEKYSIKFANWLIKKINGNDKNRITDELFNTTNNSGTHTIS